MRKIKPIIVNTIILTAAGILVNTLAMSFNVYISNRIGAQAMGVFQLILSVYGMAITLATSGAGLAATRLSAEELAVGRGAGAVKAMGKCINYAAGFSISAGILLGGSARFIAYSWLKNELAVRPLQILAVSLPFISISSVMHGYFNAVGRAGKSAVTQICSQLIKVAVTFGIVSYYIPVGIEESCIALVAGGTIAEVLAFIQAAVTYRMDKRRYKYGTAPKSSALVERLFAISLPVAFASYIRSAAGTVKQLITPLALRKSGLSADNASASYGVMRGMVLPVIFFPAVFLSSFSSLLVPRVAQYNINGEVEKIKQSIAMIFKLTLIFSICVGGIFLGFADEIGGALYKNAVTAPYIRLLAPLVPLMYFDGIVDGLLKGLNRQVSVVRINIIDSIAATAMIWFLVPLFGMRGYVLVIAISEVFNTILSLIELIRITKCSVKIGWIIKPSLAIAAAVLLVKALPLADAAFAVSVGCAAGVFLMLLSLIGGVGKDDLRILLR